MHGYVVDDSVSGGVSEAQATSGQSKFGAASQPRRNLCQQAQPLLQQGTSNASAADRSIRVDASTLRDLWQLAATARIWPAVALIGMAALNAVATAKCAYTSASVRLTLHLCQLELAPLT